MDINHHDASAGLKGVAVQILNLLMFIMSYGTQDNIKFATFLTVSFFSIRYYIAATKKAKK